MELPVRDDREAAAIADQIFDRTDHGVSEDTQCLVRAGIGAGLSEGGVKSAHGTLDVAARNLVGSEMQCV
jgi:hypothetical protein